MSIIVKKEFVVIYSEYEMEYKKEKIIDLNISSSNVKEMYN